MRPTRIKHLVVMPLATCCEQVEEESKERIRTRAMDGGEARDLNLNLNTKCSLLLRRREKSDPARFWSAILNSNEGIFYTRYSCAISAEGLLKFEV